MAVQHDPDPDAAGAAERMWAARLRWRLRGAWQWPTFVVMTLIDAVVLAALPFTGEDGSFLGGLLGAGFLNLAIVAVAAPLSGMLVRRRRPAMPAGVASDYAGATLLVALGLVLVGGGLANRAHVDRAHGAHDAGVRAARAWFARNEPATYAAHGGHENVWQPGPGLLRACLPAAEPGHDVCVYVDLSGPNITVKRDPDQQPNSVLAGPDNPGRQAR